MHGNLVVSYMNHMALNREVSASTRGQALSAFVFFFENVLGQSLGELNDLAPSQRPRRLPSMLTRDEVRRLLSMIDQQPFALMTGLLYGTGMRLMECLRLRVKDIDFRYSQIIVRDGKGMKDRVVPLPRRYENQLHEQVRSVLAPHEQDLQAG